MKSSKHEPNEYEKSMLNQFMSSYYQVDKQSQPVMLEVITEKMCKLNPYWTKRTVKIYFNNNQDKLKEITNQGMIKPTPDSSHSSEQMSTPKPESNINHIDGSYKYTPSASLDLESFNISKSNISKDSPKNRINKSFMSLFRIGLANNPNMLDQFLEVGRKSHQENEEKELPKHNIDKQLSDNPIENSINNTVDHNQNTNQIYLNSLMNTEVKIIQDNIDYLADQSVVSENHEEELEEEEEEEEEEGLGEKKEEEWGEKVEEKAEDRLDTKNEEELRKAKLLASEAPGGFFQIKVTNDEIINKGAFGIYCERDILSKKKSC